MSDLISKIKYAMLCNARQCWEQGIAAYAMAELGDMEMLVAMCHDIVIRQHADGRLCDVEGTPALTDPALCIFPVLTAARHTGDARFAEAADRNIRYLLERAPRNERGVLYHMAGTQEIWADSAAMTPANLARAGHVDFALVQMEGVCSCLYDETTGLYAHIWNDGLRKWTSPEIWGTGNGWIAIGLAWLISELEPGSPESQRMLEMYCRLADAMSMYRLPNGLFHTNLNEPESFVDCEGAVMLAYSALKLQQSGVDHPSVLREAQWAYRVIAEVEKHVNCWGFIEDCPGSPNFTAPGTSTEMQAFYLMLCAIAQNLQDAPDV